MENKEKINSEITEIIESTENQKKQKQVQNAKRLAWLAAATLGIGIGTSQLNNNTDNNLEQTGIETNIDENTSIQDNKPTEDISFISTAALEKQNFQENALTNVYLIQNKDDITGNWVTIDIKTLKEFEEVPKVEEPSRVVLAGKTDKEDDLFAIFQKEERENVDSPWIRTEEYFLLEEAPASTENTRYVFLGINPNYNAARDSLSKVFDMKEIIPSENEIFNSVVIEDYEDPQRYIRQTEDSKTVNRGM